MIPRQKHPDKKNAASILDASLRQMRYTLTLESNDNSAFTIIRNIYECFRMVGDALLVTKGIESEDHLAPIHELLKIKIQRTATWQFFVFLIFVGIFDYRCKQRGIHPTKK